MSDEKPYVKTSKETLSDVARYLRALADEPGIEAQGGLSFKIRLNNAACVIDTVVKTQEVADAMMMDIIMAAASKE